MNLEAKERGQSGGERDGEKERVRERKSPT